MFAKKDFMNVTWEQACCYTLSRLFMYEPIVPKTIVSRMGDASGIFEMDKAGLRQAMGPYSKRVDALEGADVEKYGIELEKILSGGYNYLIYSDEAFPSLLGECEDAPVGFFYRCAGSAKEVFKRQCISVVGTRDVSSYGKDWCGRIVHSLALSRDKPTIVSGLAFGVDIVAHQTALEEGLPTIAVLGTGIDLIYPRQHEMYSERILSRPDCAIVSEYPPGAGVSAVNFLGRNRIIAGLSRALVLVESKLRGGGMTTARQAWSYNRDVFAVPGRNDDVRSQGCNMLIHAHLAEPLVSCEEFLKSLNYRVERMSSGDILLQLRQHYEGSMDRSKIKCAEDILHLVKNNRDIDTESIAATLKCSIGEVLSLVGRLETDGFLCVDLLRRCSLGRRR